MLSVAEVRAVPGKGLAGDRYFNQPGKRLEGDREVTLIEMEAIENFERDYGVKFQQQESRRNIVTRGVPLNDLVGREFQVGETRLRGLRLCEPCTHLARLSGKTVIPGLVHRAGLRAQILSDGLIRVGDPVLPSEDVSASRPAEGNSPAGVAQPRGSTHKASR